jgi:proton-translocating NADH-quinone oxidoreductase chain M
MFYLLFESVLIPMFILVGIWGSRERKIFASTQLILYTLFGSLFILNGIIYFLLTTGSADINIITVTPLEPAIEFILWSLFFFGFCIKVPMMPFHLWLPEAHVEAPTAGSVLLAGVILKLGSYGFIRFLIYLWPFICLYFIPLIFVLATISVIFGSLITLRQIDIKKIIAYSSIVHMNFSLFGLFSFSIPGLLGGLIATLSHGFISSGLFLSVGVLYERYHSRLLKYYGGLAQLMPFFSIYFFFLTLGNISFPFTLNFLGEFLTILGLFYKNLLLAVLNIFSLILSTIYAFWLMNRILFGQIILFYFKLIIKNRHLHFSTIKLKRYWTNNLVDTNKREHFILVPLILISFFCGIITEYPIHTLFLPLVVNFYINLI